MAQRMPLPLTVSCFSKIQIGFTFPAHPGSPGDRAVKRVCVCVPEGSTLIFLDTWISSLHCVRWVERSLHAKKSSSIHPVASTERRLVTDKDTGLVSAEAQHQVGNKISLQSEQWATSPDAASAAADGHSSSTPDRRRQTAEHPGKTYSLRYFLPHPPPSRDFARTSNITWKWRAPTENWQLEGHGTQPVCTMLA